MPYWNVSAPNYVPPTTTTPAWVWSIVGWGRNNQDGTDVVVLRLDYVIRDATGNFVFVNNFRPGWMSGGCTRYIPVFMQLNEGVIGGAGGSFTGGYDYFMTPSPSCNTLWKGWIYKYLYGMRAAGNMVVYLPLP